MAPKYPNLGDGYGNAVILDENGVVVTARPGKDLNLVTSGGGLPKANGVTIGSGGAVLVANTTLTAAQVNALKVTPVTVIPAVAGKTIVVLQNNIVYVFGGSAFGGLDNTSNIQFSQGTDIGFSSQQMQTFLDQVSSQIALAQSFAGPFGSLLDFQSVPVTVNNSGTASNGGAGSSVIINVLYTLL